MISLYFNKLYSELTAKGTKDHVKANFQNT